MRFLGRRFRDPFGDDTTVLYDAHDLLVLETENALHNKVTVGERNSNDNIINNGNDYRVLQPALVTDSNRNRSEVKFDGLGLVAGTGIMGKSTDIPALGDSLAGTNADLIQQDIDQFYNNPTGPSAATLLGTATSRIVYDLGRFGRGTPATPSPVYAATIVRETHVSDLGPGETSKLQVSMSFSDGFGREIQRKIQAEPGPLVPDGPTVDPRWVGTGWIIFNNKGKPVRQYEPFFDDTHDFRFGALVGVSPTLFYDPVGRVVVTLHPNQTWEKVIFDSWRQESWDVNDTVLIPDPAADPDAGPFFQRIPAADYVPTWYDQRINGALEEKDAAQKAAAHANTPTTAEFDTLGRTFLTIAYNRFKSNGSTVEEHYRTLVEFDIEGNQRSVTDALAPR